MTQHLKLTTFVLACLAFAAPARPQVRTTGQIVGTVRDPSAAVVPNADIEVTDVATGNRQNGKSSNEGGFVFPTLQPGHYSILATATGFEPALIDDVVVETGRTSNVTVQFVVATLEEQVKVEGRVPVVETTSSTVSSTVRSEEIAKLPLAGRDVLAFALLTPGTATSSGARFSSFNGLPGGAINITLDGINNNSQRFRSGDTSFFVFAPVRLGAMEQVTVSTAGLTADAGAEGAVQVQFVTKRGTNAYHGEVFDQWRNDRLNANSWFNNARGLPKAKLNLNEFGGNFGGPLIQNKLFVFGNYEQIVQPTQATLTVNVLTTEAQQGIFRYAAADGTVRTANLLDIARANAIPSTLDPFIASQLATANSTLNQGTLAPLDLIRNQLSFLVPQRPTNLYPTWRIDWQPSSSLAIRGTYNDQWRNLATRPQYPGLPFVNGGFKSNYYILSMGGDWTVRSNVFNQFSFGLQSNHEEFNPQNVDPTAVYGGGNRVPFPTLTGNSPLMHSVLPTGNVLPIPRNNPVINVIDTLTLLKGTHTLTLGGSFRRTTMWEAIWGAAAGGPAFSLGVGSGDPASAVFTSATLPGIRSNDLPAALALYAFLTGRISGISGVNNVDELTHQYAQGPVIRREAQNVGGVYAQDSWRVTPQLTLNYGLRWELSGAAYNTNGIYTSPTYENLLGPSSAQFQPGKLDGVRDPVIEQRSTPYKRDFVNPAPNGGFAWVPSANHGWLAKLLAEGKTVIRGNAGINYYDEGLIAFEAAAGQNPGLTQQLVLTPGQPAFPPGGLLLTSSIPPLNANPASFQFPMPESLFTFAAGLSTINSNVRTPYIGNWTIGIQRELRSNAAFEVRYVGNHGFHLWRMYDLNEVNTIENGFVREFKNAQQNMAINGADGRPGFANNGLPGQVALPIFDAAFGARGSQPALAAASGYSNGAFVTLLQQGQAGALAGALAGNNIYLCRLLGGTFGPCANLGYDAPGPYPMNFFQSNPYLAGRPINYLTDDAWSRYHGLQLQYRQRYGTAVTIVANYTYGKAWTNRYSDAPSTLVSNIMTVRDDRLNEGPTVFDLRHAFQTYWTYDLPFGKGRRTGIQSGVLNALAGGWAVSGIFRLQSGRPFYLTSGRSTFNQYDAGVVLNGITIDQLQDMITSRPGPNRTMLFVDPKLIGPDGRANPQYLQSPTTAGVLGRRVWLYGPGYWNVDIGLAKRVSVGPTYVKVEALLLDAFNHTNFLVGDSGFIDAGVAININSTTFGQTTSTATGPRNIQLRFQVGW